MFITTDARTVSGSIKFFASHLTASEVVLAGSFKLFATFRTRRTTSVAIVRDLNAGPKFALELASPHSSMTESINPD